MEKLAQIVGGGKETAAVPGKHFAVYQFHVGAGELGSKGLPVLFAEGVWFGGEENEGRLGGLYLFRGELGITAVSGQNIFQPHPAENVVDEGVVSGGHEGILPDEVSGAVRPGSARQVGKSGSDLVGQLVGRFWLAG